MPVDACSVIPPLSRLGSPQQNSITSSPRVTSPSASGSTLPCSAVRMRAISSRRSCTSSRMRKKSSARRASESDRHAGNAAFAAWTAASTSSTEAKSTAPVCSPVAGLNTGPVRPDSPARREPPIQWLMGLTAAGASITSVISCSFSRGHRSVPPFGRRRPTRIRAWRRSRRTRSWDGRSSRTRSATSSTRGACRTRSTRSRSSAPRSQLGRLLAEVTPGDLTMSFFTNGGAEANENAIKLARWYTGRHKVIARYRSYHGATAGAITLTGDPRRWPAEPGIPGVVRMLDPYTYRCPAGHPDPCPVCTGALHLEEILQYEGPETVAAVIVETITGTNGIIVPPDGYLQSIREVCDRHGILLICDEVMAGFGRTGRWFGVDNWDVVPDIMTVAKGINSGYVPLGAMVVREPIAEWVRDKYFAGGLTYSGHPLACASAVASIEAFREEGIVEQAAASGEVFRTELARLAEKHPSVGEVRGLGCFWGIELVKDRSTREPLVPFNGTGQAALPVASLMKRALEQGLYLMTHWNVVMCCPPLTITRDELDEGLAILDDALSVADEFTNS